MDRYYGNEWGRKGATISDKTTRLEYGLTQDEIYDAIDAGKLQYRPAAMQTAAAPGLPRHCQGRLRARRHGEARPAAQASVLPPSLTACR
jgi:hypothetical protein